VGIAIFSFRCSIGVRLSSTRKAVTTSSLNEMPRSNATRREGHRIRFTKEDQQVLYACVSAMPQGPLRKAIVS
jgi:hypothetical protein